MLIILLYVCIGNQLRSKFKKIQIFFIFLSNLFYLFIKGNYIDENLIN